MSGNVKDWETNWKIFVSDNFCFYTLLFESLIQKFLNRLSFNNILINLSRKDLKESAPLLNSNSFKDLRLLNDLFNSVFDFIPQLLSFLITGTLCYHYVPLCSIMLTMLYYAYYDTLVLLYVIIIL